MSRMILASSCGCSRHSILSRCGSSRCADTERDRYRQQRRCRHRYCSARGPGAESKPAPKDIVITGRKLDVARDSITPSLGASQYTFDREALEKQPGGTNLTLNKSLLQAPGVVQDSYGVIHVRNEHANLQYRLNWRHRS